MALWQLYVQLYLPDKLLIQLSIDDPKYDLRPPLVFTNPTALFPGSKCRHHELSHNTCGE